MKQTWIRLAAVPAMAAGLLPAQNAGTSGPQPPAYPHHRFANRMEMMADVLDLTAAQREQAQSILASTQQSTQAIRQQLRQSHEALVAAIEAGNDDQIQQLAANQGVLQGQLTAIRGTAFAKIYALLTPEQKVKADQIYQNMKSMFARRFGA